MSSSTASGRSSATAVSGPDDFCVRHASDEVAKPLDRQRLVVAEKQADHAAVTWSGMVKDTANPSSMRPAMKPQSSP